MHTATSNEIVAPNQGTPGPGGLSVNQAAQFIGICRSLIFDEIRAGRLKARRIAKRRTVILYEDAVEYLRSRPVIDLQTAA